MSLYIKSLDEGAPRTRLIANIVVSATLVLLLIGIPLLAVGAAIFS